MLYRLRPWPWRTGWPRITEFWIKGTQERLPLRWLGALGGLMGRGRRGKRSSCCCLSLRLNEKLPHSSLADCYDQDQEMPSRLCSCPVKTKSWEGSSSCIAAILSPGRPRLAGTPSWLCWGGLYVSVHAGGLVAEASTIEVSNLSLSDQGHFRIGDDKNNTQVFSRANGFTLLAAGTSRPQAYNLKSVTARFKTKQNSPRESLGNWVFTAARESD